MGGTDSGMKPTLPSHRQPHKGRLWALESVRITDVSKWLDSSGENQRRAHGAFAHADSSNSPLLRVTEHRCPGPVPCAAHSLASHLRMPPGSALSSPLHVRGHRGCEGDVSRPPPGGRSAGGLWTPSPRLQPAPLLPDP